MMRFAYVTTDGVNEMLARRLAVESGRDLTVLEPRDGVPLEYDGVILDGDFVPESWWRPVVAELSQQGNRGRVAIHGYSLDDGPAGANGAFLFRRLGHEVFHRLSLPDDNAVA